MANHGQEVDFVRYLRDRGLLSESSANAIRETAATERIPLGRLLLEARVLTVRDVMQVLTWQADAPGLRFGEIAMRENLLTSDQLEAALRKQQTARSHQIDVVRKQNLMSPCELHALVVDYVNFLELRITALDENITPLQEAGIEARAS